MARPVSDEELQLKKRARRRLIGAIVLVTTVAVVLPMVLDSEPRTVSQDINISIPSPDAGAFSSKVAPLPAESKPGAKAPAAPESAAVAGAKPAAEPEPAAGLKETAKAADKPEAGTAPSKAAAQQEPVKKAVPAPKEPAARKAAPAAKEDAARKPAPEPAGSFVIQVVALSDAEKAKQMQHQITAAGIKAYTEVVKTAKGDVTRVRVGPFATRNAAEKAQQQLKAIGLDGKIVPK